MLRFAPRFWQFLSFIFIVFVQLFKIMNVRLPGNIISFVCWLETRRSFSCDVLLPFDYLCLWVEICARYLLTHLVTKVKFPYIIIWSLLLFWEIQNYLRYIWWLLVQLECRIRFFFYESILFLFFSRWNISSCAVFTHDRSSIILLYLFLFWIVVPKILLDIITIYRSVLVHWFSD